MLGAYFAVSLIRLGLDFWTAALLAGLGVALFGGIVERLILRRLAGAELAQVLVTLGLSFMVADVCLMVWTGDPIQLDTPGAASRLHVRGGLGLSHLSPRRQRHRHHRRRGPVGLDRADAARRDDPRRRRRPGDGARHRHSRLAALHDRVLSGCVAGGLRGRDRRADPLRLSGARSGDAAARPRARRAASRSSARTVLPEPHRLRPDHRPAGRRTRGTISLSDRDITRAPGRRRRSTGGIGAYVTHHHRLFPLNCGPAT